jgi:putative tricarboxylic transport membrane protein
MSEQDSAQVHPATEGRPRNEKVIDLVITLVALGLSLAAIIHARESIQLATGTYLADRIGPRGFPYILGGAAVILCVVLLITQIVDLRGGRQIQGPDERAEDDARHPASAARAFSMVGLAVVYVLCLNTIGYLIATVALMAVGLVIMGTRSRLKLILLPVVYSLITFCIFDVWLNVRIPRGLLESALGWLGV